MFEGYDKILHFNQVKFVLNKIKKLSKFVIIG
jgi:hypothetical protein